MSAKRPIPPFKRFFNAVAETAGLSGIRSSTLRHAAFAVQPYSDGSLNVLKTDWGKEGIYRHEDNTEAVLLKDGEGRSTSLANFVVHVKDATTLRVFKNRSGHVGVYKYVGDSLTARPMNAYVLPAGSNGAAAAADFIAYVAASDAEVLHVTEHRAGKPGVYVRLPDDFQARTPLFSAREEVWAALARARTPAPPDPPLPIPMLIWCPQCSARHIDVGEFATKPHHTHACQQCGHCWRPAIVHTVGVQFLPGFKNENEVTP